MARDGNIVNDIRGSNQTNNTHARSTGELTLEKARAQYKEDAAKKLQDTVNKNVEAQAKLEALLRAKGLKESDALWKKYLSEQARVSGKWNEILAKEKQIQELKDIEEIYSLETNLQDQLLEQKKKTNEAILKSEMATMEEKMGAFGSLLKNNVQAGLGKAANAAINGITDDLNGIMSTYAQYQAKINARIQGTFMTYKRLEDNLSTAVGIQPYVKTQDMVSNLAQLVDSGIAYNMEMRAFLQTVSENIATTFNAFDSNLTRLIRLQQVDSTAARLGLEARLTRYFNTMYQDTSYLSNAFDSVEAALLEASSTMSHAQAVEFEYQVQKWLGSLYGVGLSDETVAGIAGALGMLGSGNVTGLANSQYQNLLVMAASRAGLSYGDLLTGGLNASNTNVLLESMVEYLKEIAAGTNKVVQSELGRVFGVSMSDLQSALNMNTGILNNVSSQNLSYIGSLAELVLQLQSLPSRMSIATMMDNLWENLEWSLGTGVASNPALYGIWKVTDMIQSYTGGIAVPSAWAMGNGFSLNTTIENLIKLGVVGISSLGMIGDLISGLSSTAAPGSMYLKLQGLSSIQSLGRGLVTSMSGMSTSQTTVAGNSSGEDYYSSTKNQAQGEGEQAVADSQENSDSAKQMKEIHDYTQNIFELLTDLNRKLDTSLFNKLDSAEGLRVSLSSYGPY